MNSIDKQYQQLLQDILDNGVKKSDRTGTGTISVFGRQIRHRMSEGFPLLTTKKMHFKGIVAELLWFLKGDTNIKWLLENDCKIWVGDAYQKYKRSYMFSSNPISYKDSNPENGPWDEQDFIRLIIEDKWFGSVHGELGKIYGHNWANWNGKTDDELYESYLKKIRNY